MTMRNLVLFSLCLAACGGGGTPDAGPPDTGTPIDAGGTPDAGTGVDVRSTISYIDPVSGDPTPLPPAAAGDPTAHPLSTSCVGMARIPPETTPTISITATAKDFFSHDAVTMVQANFYPDNAIPFDHSCTGMCMTGLTDATAGTVMVMDHDMSWYAYYMAGRMGPDMAHTPVPTAEFNEPAAAAITLNSVSQQTLAIIPTVLGLSRVPGTAIIAGTVYDCNDEPVTGVVIRAFRADGTLIAEPPDGTMGFNRMPAYRYFDTTDTPSAGQGYTNVDGLYAAANMPAPTDSKIRVEAWENHMGTPRMWGCEEINVFADGVTIINIRPYHSDGPHDCTETPTALP